MIELLALGALALLGGAALREADNSARGPTAMHRSYYRTRDGEADYRFGFQQQPDSSWRAYILAQPDYNGRSTSPHVTHRLSDGYGQYICWTAPIRSLEEAKRVASLWAEQTQTFIKTGRRF